MAPTKKQIPFSEYLIQEVQKHHSLWNKTSKDYKNTIVKSNAWKKILNNIIAVFSEDDLKELDVRTIEDVKKKWKNLRDVYNRKKKEAKGKSGCGLEDVEENDWPFFRSMQYLDQSEVYGDQSLITNSFIGSIDVDDLAFFDLENQEMEVSENPGFFAENEAEEGGVENIVEQLTATTSKCQKRSRPESKSTRKGASRWEEIFSNACKSVVESNNSEDENPSFTFGKFVGQSLHAMNEEARKSCMRVIMEAILNPDQPKTKITQSSVSATESGKENLVHQVHNQIDSQHKISVSSNSVNQIQQSCIRPSKGKSIVKPISIANKNVSYPVLTPARTIDPTFKNPQNISCIIVH